VRNSFLPLFFLILLLFFSLLYGTVSIGAELPAGHIAFLSGQDTETYKVHVLNLQTKEIKQISLGTNHGQPVWSSDGTYLSFSLKTSDGLCIAIYNYANDEIKVIKHTYPWNDAPSWSADNKYLAYVACEKGLVDQKLCIYNIERDEEEFWGGEKIPSVMTPVWFPKLDILNAMSATVSQVTYAEGFDIHKFFEEGYSLGVLIAVAIIPLESKRFSTELILVSKTQVTILPKELMLESDRFEELNPQVSPKGSSLVFETNEGGNREIYYLGRRGISNISNHHASDWNPVWSPNGEWVAFESFRNGRRGIYRVYPETARVFPIAVSADFDCWSPTWAPDNKWICFVSNRTGTPQIYLKHIAEDEFIPLTNSVTNLAPCWRPKPK